MSENYRLVFAGEVLEDQHTAVVQKRLAAVLKLDDERMQVLFSGKPVVVKKAADQATAARYQAAFKKAGARLRVLAADGGAAAPQQAQTQTAEPQAKPKAAPQPPTPGEMSVMPAGADLLTDAERGDEPAHEIDTSHLALQGALFITDEPQAPVDTPNVDHISLAELGTQLGPDESPVEVDISVDFELAELGSVIAEADKAPPTPEIEADFDLAAAGERLSAPREDSVPPAPNTDHLDIEQPDT